MGRLVQLKMADWELLLFFILFFVLVVGSTGRRRGLLWCRSGGRCLVLCVLLCFLFAYLGSWLLFVCIVFVSRCVVLLLLWILVFCFAFLVLFSISRARRGRMILFLFRWRVLRFHIRRCSLLRFFVFARMPWKILCRALFCIPFFLLPDRVKCWIVELVMQIYEFFARFCMFCAIKSFRCCFLFFVIRVKDKDALVHLCQLKTENWKLKTSSIENWKLKTENGLTGVSFF